MKAALIFTALGTRLSPMFVLAENLLVGNASVINCLVQMSAVSGSIGTIARSPKMQICILFMADDTDLSTSIKPSGFTHNLQFLLGNS